MCYRCISLEEGINTNADNIKYEVYQYIPNRIKTQCTRQRVRAGSYEKPCGVSSTVRRRCADFYFAENFAHSYALTLSEKDSFLKR